MSNLTSVKNIGLVTLTINQNAEQQVNFIDSSFTRLEQFSNATYSISGLGTLDIPSLDINYSFKVVDPLSGHFGEYPHEGKVEAFTSESDIIQISSNFVNNSDAFNIKVGSEIYSEYWSQAVEGSLWSFSNGHTNYVKNYRSDNFDFVGVLDTDKLSSFPVSGGSIRALMSRTIKKEEYGTTIYFQTDDWPYTQIPAEITTSGAILYLTPQSPLSDGRTYNINSFEVTSEKEVTSWVPYINNIVVNDSLIMNYDIGTELYKENDYPILDASASIMNEGTALKFTWVDINNIGITFSNKNSAVTSFTAPEKYTEDVFIRLILSNSQGYEVHSDIKLSYFTPSSTMMHFVSPLGDYVGAGQTLTMNSSDALFTISRNGWDNEDHIGVRVDGNTWWTLDIAAPKGQQLTTKRYENATRYPFQAPLAPGLDFNGDHRGCSSVLGEFEIIELTYDADNQVEKLAVNFQQSCEQTSPVLKGLIRYNSSAKLN